MKKTRKIIFVNLILVFVLLFSTFFTVFGLTKVKNSTINTVSVGKVEGKIIEQYEQNQIVYAGQIVPKIVQVKNIGNVDAIIRVSVDKFWQNLNLDAENIIFDVNDGWALKDGYYYYKSVLKPEQISTPLFNNFSISPNLTNAYSGASGNIVINMEMIQAQGNAISFWNTSFNELNIKYIEQESIDFVTSVTFENYNTGFKFKLNNGDLFANFKGLVPGETRSQKIKVSNDHSSAVNIYMQANIPNQLNVSEKDRQLIYMFLQNYVTISIVDENGRNIYRGPLYDNNFKKINLGYFAAESSRYFVVNLSVSSLADNEYSDLLGKIVWIFSAENMDKTSNISSTPDTGALNYILIFIMIFVISLLVILCNLVYVKHNRSKNE